MLNLFGAMKKQRTEERDAQRYRDIIHQEAAVGGQLFGPVPKGGRREFFCLDEHTWVWHEEWVDQTGKRQVVTTRYDVRPQGVFKAQDGQAYRPLSLEETKHFFKAINLYYNAVTNTVFSKSSYYNSLSKA
jgi:hypothetical protein